MKYSTVLTGAVMSAVLASAPPPVQSQEPANEDADDAARMREMIVRAQSMQLRVGDGPDVLRVAGNPIFRYSDAARDTVDGTLWLWEHASEPLALLALFRDPREGFEWNYELVLLGDGPLSVTGRPGWSWRPGRHPREWRPIDGPPVASQAAKRLTQLKAVARQFVGTEVLDKETYRLRLLPKPVHRYSRTLQGVRDGSLFLFAYGTNPEIVLQIEALDESPGWRVAFAPLSSAELAVMRDQTVVWRADPVLEWEPTAAYFSHYGPDPAAVDPGTETPQ